MTEAKKTDPSSVPTLYVDQIINLFNNRDVVKFYMVRKDPDFSDFIEEKTTLVGQVAMPIDAFIETVAFFHVTCKNMITKGYVSQEDYDQAIKVQEE